MLLLLGACVILGVLLSKAHSRESQLQVRLSNVTAACDDNTFRIRRLNSNLAECQAQVARSEEALAAIRWTLENTEAALGESASKGATLVGRVNELVNRVEVSERRRILAESNVERTNSALKDLTEQARRQLSESEEKVAECVSAALRLRSILEDAASAINSGTRFLTDIPSDFSSSFSTERGLAGEYEKMVKKYNSLVGRFNAAVERCNELQDTVNSVIRVLRR